jgi:hypothetical protein
LKRRVSTEWKTQQLREQRDVPGIQCNRALRKEIRDFPSVHKNGFLAWLDDEL